MSFDVDAIIGTPPPARRLEASTPEPGESFAEHLAEATPEETPVETRPRAPAEEKSDAPAESTEPPPEATAQPAPTPATPAPIVVQVIASAAAPLGAPTPELNAEAPQLETQRQPAAAIAATPLTPIAPVTTKNAAKPQTVSADSAPVDEADPTQAATAPVIEPSKTLVPKASPATQAPSQDAPAATPAPNPATSAPVEHLQAAPALVVATAPVSDTVEPTVPLPEATRAIDADASRGAVKAAPEMATRAAKPAGPQQASVANAAPSAVAAKENFATMLAAQTDAPGTGAPALASQPASIAASSAQASTPQHVAHEQAVARAAPAAMQVGREIVRRFNGESTRYELRLDPPELGRVDVRLDVSRDHRVSAVIAADSPQTLAELSRHARDLEAALQSAGLQLNHHGLSFDLSRQREGGEAEQTRGGSSRSSQTDETTEATPLARPIGLERWRGVRVDVMA